MKINRLTNPAGSKKSQQNVFWTEEDLQKLRTLTSGLSLGQVNWTDVATFFVDKSNINCRSEFKKELVNG